MATTLRMATGGSSNKSEPPPPAAPTTRLSQGESPFDPKVEPGASDRRSASFAPDPDLAPPTPPVPLAAAGTVSSAVAPSGSASAAPSPYSPSASAPPPAAEAPGVAASGTVFMTGRPRCPVCGERFSRGSRFCAFDGTRLVDAAEEPSSDPLVGQLLDGKYTVIRPIGEGGMGTVYEVRHSALDRRFALKVLRPDIAQNAEHMQRFLQEAKAAAAIGHPNIVSVSDFGECEIRGHRVPYFVMEFLRGASLAQLLKIEKTLPSRRCAKIIAACAEALAAAHVSGVIHRDLKPDNIFLMTSEAGDRVKVLDFGVAKMQGAARLTKLGMVFGTPHYMSPEQARGQPIDHRADIYALGVILYECLSGRVPFEADTSMGVLTKQIFANPEPIERVSLDPRGLGALGAIVMRCLAKEPDERYASMDELASALRQIWTDPTGAAARAVGDRPKHRALRLREEAAIPPSVPPPAEPAPRPWSRVVGFSAIGVAALGVLFLAVRALFFGPGGPAQPGSGASDAPASAATTAPPASTAPASAATTAASAEASSQAPPPSTAAAAVEPPPSTAAAATAPPAGSATSSRSGTATGKPGPKSSTGVVDPWGGTSKKPTSATVVDPWKKR